MGRRGEGKRNIEMRKLCQKRGEWCERERASDSGEVSPHSVGEHSHSILSGCDPKSLTLERGTV